MVVKLLVVFISDGQSSAIRAMSAWNSRWSLRSSDSFKSPTVVDVKNLCF